MKKVIQTLGPGFIIASVCLGPGSVTASSKIGSEHGYQLLWVIILSSMGMAMYTYMGARFGTTHDKSFLDSIAETYGKWFSILIGISCFMMAASFQFGNNLGVATASHAITGISEIVWPFLFTGLALILVFFAKNLYKILEKLMIVLVMVMISAFFINLVFTKPSLVSAAEGFVPSIPTGAINDTAALVATTFVLHACLYQAYLVQDKGWKAENLAQSTKDSITGISMLGGITILVIITSAAALHPRGIVVASAADMALQLEALFGKFSKYIFSLGLWAAAFSSLTVNAMVGGRLLSDGLGVGRTMEEKAPKLFTALILLVGMTIAVFFKGNIVHALVLAQASSLFAVPSVAIGMFLIANNKKVMGNYANTAKQNIIAVFGLVLILVMVYHMYNRLIGFIGRL